MIKRLSRLTLLFFTAFTLYACSTKNAPIDLSSLVGEEETGQLKEIVDEAEDESLITAHKSIAKVTPTDEPEDADEDASDSADEGSVSGSDELFDNIEEDVYYYDLESVVLYYEKYNKLPHNFITKNKARALGWERGRVSGYKEGAAIGGDHFGNYEKVLPDNRGTEYIECDIDTQNASRGSKRLVISNTGRYYYTEDHYETFREVVVRDGHVEFAGYGQ